MTTPKILDSWNKTEFWGVIQYHTRKFEGWVDYIKEEKTFNITACHKGDYKNLSEKQMTELLITLNRSSTDE